MPVAIIVGVGPSAGLGAALCRHAAQAGLHVFAGGRTLALLEETRHEIEAAGGNCTPVVTDVTAEEQVQALIEQAEQAGQIELAIYNAGNNYSSNFLEMEASLFEQAWRVGTLGGFLFARETLRRMVPRNQGTLIFTGASASLRGKPKFAPFTAAKAGLRTMSQSLAREFQPQGIHVAHVVIDGIIDGDRIRNRAPALVEQLGEDGMLQLDDIASAYMFLHQQPRSAWTHELDLRTFQENF